jgi:hypothetical protein
MTCAIDPKCVNPHKSEIMGVSAEDVEFAFELTPKDFLDFAGDDLKGRSDGDSLNALGNIKRSIDCLFDSLLFAVGFLENSKQERWTFPEKMNFLGEIGIITPYVLGRINSARNLLEHEFKKPDRTEVETAYDVATLLYYATFRFTKRFFNIVDMAAEYRGEAVSLEINLNRGDRTVNVSDRKQKIFVAWTKDPDNYKRWLSVVYQVLSID